MTQIIIGEHDNLERAIKTFRRMVQRSHVLKDLRKKRHYVKPSVARRLKEQAAKRRKVKGSRRER